MNIKANLRHLCLPIAAVAALCGCTGDDGLSAGKRSVGGAEFVVSGIAAQTRVSHSGYVRSAMEPGDELGAFVVVRTSLGDESTLPTYGFMPGYTENARYRVVDGAYTGSDDHEYTHALQPEVPMDTFPAHQRYVFYYPYKANADIQDFSHTVVADQSRETAFESSDLLRARVNATTDVSVVPSSIIGTDEATGRQLIGVTMEHVMASVVLRVESQLVPTDATGREAKLLNMYRTVSGVDLTRALSKDEQTGAGYEVAEKETVDQGDITMWNSGQETVDNVTYEVFRAVFPAQRVEAGAAFLSFIFNGDTVAKTYKMTANGSNALVFEPGRYYMFTLAKDSGLRFNGIIDDLEDGGDYFYEY